MRCYASCSIDNYDSFVYNLARYFQRLGQTTQVVRNTAIDVRGRVRLRPAALVLSPGPCRAAAGRLLAGIGAPAARNLPILGVCLGHQIDCRGAWAGGWSGAAEPVHGRASPVYHHGRGIFAGLPSPIVRAAAIIRWWSTSSRFRESLEVAARTDDGVVMAIRHRRLPLVGLQFHPESILTEHG